MKKLALVLLSLLFISTSIYSQSTKTPKINKKQKVQLKKIENGVKTGELTRFEAKRLLNKEAKLQKKKKMAIKYYKKSAEMGDKVSIKVLKKY